MIIYDLPQQIQMKKESITVSTDSIIYHFDYLLAPFRIVTINALNNLGKHLEHQSVKCQLSSTHSDCLILFSVWLFDLGSWRV
jgi:hypothetical protein